MARTACAWPDEARMESQDIEVNKQRVQQWSKSRIVLNSAHALLDGNITFFKIHQVFGFSSLLCGIDIEFV